MSYFPRLTLIILFLTLTLLPSLLPALAQSGGEYDLSWSTLDSGGGTSSNSEYSLTGVIGQPDAGVLAGGEYSLNGGFLINEVSPTHPVYLPLLLRGSNP
jgi:hypothetical protein